MTTLYLVQQGTSVRREQKQFVLEPPGGNDTQIPVREVEQILLFGNIHLTTPATSTCLYEKIPVLFLSHLGDYKGHLWSAEHGSLDLELAQFQRRTDADFQLEIARAIVKGKVQNSKQLLLRLNRKRDVEAVAKATRGLDTDIAAIDKVDNLESLRGCEGAAAARYFPALGQLLVAASNFQFSHRHRRPPIDPINSMLSFGYTLLFNNVLSLILAEGLHPYLGNLHRSERKEPHLAFDLMEEFRSPIVDSLVLTLANKQAIKPTDFTTPNAEGGVYLTERARRAFLNYFEERMNTETSHPDVQAAVSYRRAIQLQIRRYRRSLLEEVPYTAFLRTV
jgi:CRISP-associated protein Cas1